MSDVRRAEASTCGWTRPLACTLALLLGVFTVGTSVAATSSLYTYDALVVARIDVYGSEVAEAGQVLVSDVREASASPSAEARGTSTTPSPRSVATNTVDPNTVRFSQDSAGATFRDGRSVSDMSADLKSGALNPSDVPPIRLVDQGGELFTLDNRRLIAFQDAGVQVPYRMATASEITKDAFKFTSQNGGTSIQLRFW